MSWAAASFPEYAEELRLAAYTAADSVAGAPTVEPSDTGVVHEVAAAHAAASAASAAAASVLSITAAKAVSARMAARSAPITHPEGLAFDAAFAADAVFVNKGRSASERVSLAADLGGTPLWRGDVPESIAAAWMRLKTALVAVNEGWEVWIEWYEDRLAGRISVAELELARAILPDEFWRRGPKLVNGEIRRVIQEKRAIFDAVIEPVPPQGAGPHFTLSRASLIALAPPVEIDAAGNNFARIHQLLPLVRRAADDLIGHLNANAFPELTRNVADYRAALAAEQIIIAWGVVFGFGVMLENAAIAARRRIEDRLQPPLEDAAHTALESLLTLHGPLILATAEGRDLSEEADRMRLTREQQAKLRSEVQVLTRALKQDVDIIEHPAADLVVKAAEVMDQGDHPERGTMFGLATVKNLAVVLVSAATVFSVGTEVSGLAGPAAGAGAAWFSLEALKKSKVFQSAMETIGSGINQLLSQGETRIRERMIALAPFRRFVLTNEESLRRIAGTTTQLRWMSSYIDLIVQTGSRLPDGGQPPE